MWTSSSPRLASCSWKAIETAVAHAIAKHHPELLEQRRSTGSSPGTSRCATRPSEYAGTSWLDITGDTLDLTAFHDLVCDQAAVEGARDTDELEVRKAKALGVIASQQAQLDLTTLLGSADGDSPKRDPAEAEDPVLPPPEPRRPRHPRHCGGASEMAAGRSSGSAPPPSPGSRSGSATPRSPSSRSSTWPQMRSTGTNHPRGCASWSSSATATASSPGATTTPDQPTSTTSTPTSHRRGRTTRPTHPGNLAPLCRRHHRAKTSRRWRYRRRPDSTYEWHGPHGRATWSHPTAPSSSPATELHP
ncbi:hypothetical protein [Nocardioides ungokensis]|uniref:hypothetical protein n=1 Tax=Nocardioides ungokensis TaxID=1643322 RepID=UPI0015DE1C3B|nr:hypothetical protein [Nocardioides ungokensis]